MGSWAACSVSVQLERSIAVEPALYSSMKPVGPIRNSLIVIGLTFRTFSTAVSICFGPPAELVHHALPTRSPSKGAGPEVTLNLALRLEPGARGSAIVVDTAVDP